VSDDLNRRNRSMHDCTTVADAWARRSGRSGAWAARGRRLPALVTALVLLTVCGAVLATPARANHECGQWEIAKLVFKPFSLNQESMINQRNGWQVKLRFNQVANTLKGPADIFADKVVSGGLLVHGTLVARGTVVGTLIGTNAYFTVSQTNGTVGEYQGTVLAPNPQAGRYKWSVSGRTWDRRSPGSKVAWTAPAWCGRPLPHGPSPPDPGAPR
jgi:hypothetical protein